MRLDKYLCRCGLGSRKKVHQMIRLGQIKVNASIIKQEGYPVNEEKDEVYYQNQKIEYEQYIYIMLHKPKGYVTSTQDKEPTVLDLLPNFSYRPLSPVGRLDKDTEGLLLLTDDGALLHELTSPKHHVDKVYYVEVERPLSRDLIPVFENGILLQDGYQTLPAALKILSTYQAKVTIHEGKYHQVKRMFAASNNYVTYLKRIAFGSLILDDDLKLGTYRFLTNEEINKLKKDSNHDHPKNVG